MPPLLNQQRDTDGREFVEGAMYYLVDSDADVEEDVRTLVIYLGLGKNAAEQSRYFVGRGMNPEVYDGRFVFCNANNPQGIKIPVSTNANHNVNVTFERYTPPAGTPDFVPEPKVKDANDKEWNGGRKKTNKKKNKKKKKNISRKTK